MRSDFGMPLGMVAVLCMSGVVGVGRADVIYSEGVSGDLSDNPASPALRTLSPGTHTIGGSVGSGDTQDWINLSVPSGMLLTSITLDSYESSDAKAFMGVQAGDFFAGPDQDPASYLGYAHFGPSVMGENLLARLGDAFGSQGFDPPLQPGNYTFLFQQFGDSTDYQFSVSVVAVPEPAAAALAVCGIATILFRRR